MPAPRSGSNGPAAYGPTDDLDPSCLVPGVQVRRYTEAAPDGRLDVIAPCCGRIARLRGDWHADHLVLCTSWARWPTTCRSSTRTTEAAGALCVVRDEQPVLVRRRASGWLAHQHPGDLQPPTSESQSVGGQGTSR